MYTAHSYSWSYPWLADSYQAPECDLSDALACLAFPRVFCSQALHGQLGKDWGFIVEEHRPDGFRKSCSMWHFTCWRPFTAPVWVSEFGTFSDCHKALDGFKFYSVASQRA